MCWDNRYVVTTVNMTDETVKSHSTDSKIQTPVSAV